MSLRPDVAAFRNIPIFSDCDPVHLQLLAFSAMRERFEPGSTLFAEGEKRAAAYLVLGGHLEISSRMAGRIGAAGPGAMLGEVAMIGNTAYSITARATEPVTTARIDRSLFMRVAQEFPGFGDAVFNALSKKLDVSVADLGAARAVFDRARSFKRL